MLFYVIFVMVNGCLLDRIEELFVERQEKMRNGLISKYGISEDVAPDLIMIAFQKALVNINGFRGEAALETWLETILINTTIDYLKSRNRPGGKESIFYRRYLNTDGLESLDPSPEEELIRREDIGLYERALEKLTPKRKEVLLLVYEGLSAKEIASKLNIPIGTALTRIYHARRHYLRALDGSALEYFCRLFNVLND